jgi:sialate O-acetylesterase
MIAAWRSAFNDADMAFGILSLCTEGTAQTWDNYCEMMANPGPWIREAQYQTFLERYQAGDKNIGFASTYDLRRRWYHPQLKIPAGERMARWAMATQYGFARTIRWKPPMVVEIQVEEDRLELRLDEPASAVDDGGPILGFAVAGEDRKFHPATAEYLVTGKNDRGQPQTDKHILVLSSPMVPQPIHYRYAWGRSPLGNLQADRNSDIPFATQRSDAWSLENVPLGVFEEEVVGKLNGQQQRKQIEALQRQDVERILFEADMLKETKK